RRQSRSRTSETKWHWPAPRAVRPDRLDLRAVSARAALSRTARAARADAGTRVGERDPREECVGAAPAGPGRAETPLRAAGQVDEAPVDGDGARADAEVRTRREHDLAHEGALRVVDPEERGSLAGIVGVIAGAPVLADDVHILAVGSDGF